MRNYEKSLEQFEKAKLTLAGGVSSSLRSAMKPVPLYLVNGEGSRIQDIDGNEYIDYILGYGPLILGHSHPELLQFVSQYIIKGQQYGMQHEGEIELSKRIVELVPSAEKVTFGGSGTEAMMLALRLARAKTGRQKVVRFEGHYHGWSDAIFTSFAMNGVVDSKQGSLAGTKGQSLHALEDIILLPWNDIEALESTVLQHGEEIAAVVNEAIMCNSGCIRANPGYLEAMRKLTEDNGIVLIFDEVITGFRVSPGGAQQFLGVTPDLTTMAKAIAGGFQLSAVAGKAEIMDLISNGTVQHFGTLNGNHVSIGAGIATLDILNRNQAAVYDHMRNIADKLVHGLKEVMAEKGLPLLINQAGSVFSLMFTTQKEVVTFKQYTQRDVPMYERFAEELLNEGVVIRPNGLWYVSAAHTDNDVEETLSKVRKTFVKKTK